MKVLHISDIHFNYKNFESEVLRNRLLRYIDENNIKVDAIIITGDCVYQYGKTKECENFIKDLRMKTGCKKCNVFICPGNHDVDRHNNKREKKVLEIRETKADITAKVYDELVADGYDRFCSFYRESTGRKYNDFGVIQRSNEDSKYRIISVNTCLLSQDDNDEGKLRVCCNKLESISNEKYNDDCINILIMHHGIEYFQEEEILKFQHWLDDNYIDIVMCGHSHRGGISVLTDTKFEIKQFVCGATMLDNYTIPSFLVYDFNIKESIANIKLHTFSNDGWAMENSHLRAFKNGEYQYKLCRLHKIKQKKELARSPKVSKIVFNQGNSMEKLNAAQIAFLDELDQKVFIQYGKKILSSKYGSLENFSTEKIICSLLNIGMPFEMTLKVVETVVDTLVSLDYRKSNFGELTTEQIRNEVYYTICRLSFESDNKIDIYEWAGKYARRYGHNSTILKIVDVDGNAAPISLKYISDNIIKDMFCRVTGNNNCYDSLLRTEINKIALDIMEFLKGCDAYYLDYEKLISFLIEIASRAPHPYIVSKERKEKILEYHSEKAKKHLQKLKNKEAEHITILETLYHSGALLVSIYSNVTGYLETSPITILHQSIARMGVEDDKIPISKISMVDLKKDMGYSDIPWKDFVYLVYNICGSDIMKKTNIQQDNDVVPRIISFSEIAIKIYNNYKGKNVTCYGKMEMVLPAILSKGVGFVVKKPLKKQRNCFWVTTNWKREVALAYGLREQILVVITSNIADDLEKVKKYLSSKIENCGETIWIKEGGEKFDIQQKNIIKDQINDIGIQAYFLDRNILEKWKNSDVRKELFEFLIMDH